MIGAAISHETMLMILDIRASLAVAAEAASVTPCRQHVVENRRLDDAQALAGRYAH
jgi:hypothetical protein